MNRFTTKDLLKVILEIFVEEKLDNGI